MSKRKSYPTEIDHRSWGFNHSCPLGVRWMGSWYCKQSFDNERMMPIPFGCDPACENLEALLENPYWLSQYERNQEEISHHDINARGEGVWRRKP